MVPERSSTATEQSYLEDNIATVAFHLGQPGARLLQEAEKGPPRTITEWRTAVENLSVTLGPAQP